MSSKQQHNAGVNGSSLMMRNLKLEGPVDEKRKLIAEEINQLLGVDSVSIDASESLLKVIYDATKRQLDEVEDIVRKYECDIADDWWTHFKEGYYKFVDQNVKDNASHEPWSCHKRPPAR